MRLSNRVIAFNQSKRSEWFRRIQYFISLRLKWQCSKRNGPCFSCASIELWVHFGSWESTREAREALSFASCHSNAYLVLSQLPACIHNSIHATLSMDHFLIGTFWRPTIPFGHGIHYYIRSTLFKMCKQLLKTRICVKMAKNVCYRTTVFLWPTESRWERAATQTRQVHDVLRNSPKWYQTFPFSYWIAYSVWLNSYILTTNQLILYWHCKAKLEVDKFAAAERVFIIEK